MTNWVNKEELEQVAKLLEQKCSASEIGEKIGRSRNAIISMVHRYPELKKIGLQGNFVSRKRKKATVPAIPRAPQIINEPPFEDLVIDADAMKPSNCRWVYGDPKIKVEYCGHKKVKGSYCTHHHGIVYRKGD